MKIISAALIWLACLTGAHAQGLPPLPVDGPPITPIFLPANTEVSPAQYVKPAVTSGKSNGKIVPVAAQMGQKTYSGEENLIDPLTLLDLPGPQRLFTRESELHLYERIGQDRKRTTGDKAIFPVEPIVTKQVYQARQFAPMHETVEPGYVLHGRLYFEQPNFERGLWNLGVAQPVVCLGVFAYDLVMYPYHFSTNLQDRADGNVGKCLPGDPAPFRVPIERFSVTGALGEAGAIIGGAFMFP